VIRTRIPPDEIEAVRVALLSWMQERDEGYGQVAVRCHISYHAVADFCERRNDSHRTIAHVLAYLPLGKLYFPPTIRCHTDAGDAT